MKKKKLYLSFWGEFKSLTAALYSGSMAANTSVSVDRQQMGEQTVAGVDVVLS